MDQLKWYLRTVSAVALGVYIAAFAWHLTLGPDEDTSAPVQLEAAHCGRVG